MVKWAKVYKEVPYGNDLVMMDYCKDSKVKLTKDNKSGKYVVDFVGHWTSGPLNEQEAIITYQTVLFEELS